MYLLSGAGACKNQSLSCNANPQIKSIPANPKMFTLTPKIYNHVKNVYKSENTLLTSFHTKK